MEHVRLKDVCTLINGRAYKQEELLSNGKYPVLRVGNFFSDKDFYYSDLELDEDKYCENGDLLFAWSASFGPKIWTGEKVIYHYHIWKMVLSDRVDKEYLYYYLLYLCERIKAEGHGGIMIHTTKAEMEEREILLPSLEQQKEFVRILNRMQTIIQNRKLEVQKLDDLIKARFVEMFDDGYPEDSLINLCNIIDYRGKTPEKVESGLPFITAKNIKMHQMNMEPREYISKDTYDKVMVRGFPKEGDVVFTTEAPLGNVCRIPHFDTEFYIGQRIVTLQTVKLIPAYLEYAVSTDAFRQKYIGKSSGSTVTGIRVRLLEQLTIPVPPRELQLQFEAFVKQVDKSKIVVQKALKETQLLFDSLMQSYFG